MASAQKLKRYSLLGAITLLVLIMGIVLRGPHVSNALKKIILPELESATGEKVIAGKIYMNVFPLFIEAKDLKIFDSDGRRILLIKRVKAYIGLSGFFNRTITLRRLVIREPAVSLTQEKAEAIAGQVSLYLAKTRPDSLKVKVLAVELQDATAELSSAALKTSAAVQQFGGEVIIGDTQRVRIEAGSVVIRREGLPEIAAGLSGRMLLKSGSISLQDLAVISNGTKINAEGELSGGVARISTTADILIATIKKLFGLAGSGEGRITVRGTIRYIEKIILDLALSGDLYLETLMELLKVKEKLSGKIALKGEIKGPLRDLKAQGTATMTGGNLYDVEIDTVTCRVVYEKGTLSFLDGKGRLYNGIAKASASIALPTVNHFTLDIAFAEADSGPLFKLIGWDPGVPRGKVNGTLVHSGPDFSPKGVFDYATAETGKDILGRVKAMTGNYGLDKEILTLSDLRIKTETSEASAGGTVDLKNHTLDLPVIMKTADLHEVTAPYFEALKGEGEFAGKVSGTFEDPQISGKARLEHAVIGTYAAETITADLIYRKDLLQVRELIAGDKRESAVLNGTIAFRDAKALFDISRPTWDLRALLKNIDSGRFVKIFYPRYAGTGMISATVRLGGAGKTPEIRAEVSLEKATVFDVPIQAATFEFSYASSRLDFSHAAIHQGDSTLRGSLTIFPDDSFSYQASSDRIRLSDIIRRPLQGEVIASLSSEGRGTFDNPAITLSARMSEGILRGKQVGKGEFTAALKDHDYTVKARLINDRITVSAKGRTDGIMPWELSADIQTGRYDFLVTSLLRDIPEDLILSLNGSVSLHGTRNQVAGSAQLKHVVLSMYGHSFTSEHEISLDLKDRDLSFGTVTMKSGDARLVASGGLSLGKSYNVTLEGSSALSPFKSFSKKLGVLKGDAEFIVSISGGWENPKVNGGISLVNGSVGLKDYPSYRISSLAGYLYMDNDRVVLHNLAGKLGGGDIALTGVLYLKKFVFSRFYVEASLNNITSALLKDSSINFDGSILYKGTPEAQMVSGNVYINRALYRDRVEWKSWLLQARKTEKIKSEISNLEKAGLNISITGQDSLLIDNNVARAKLSSDLVLRGTISRPVLFGRLGANEGTVFFRNNEFKILQASADFADPKRLNPVITINAETNIRGYRIKMNLEGQLDHFNMSLSSDPPLKEMDVLALLTVGQTSVGTKGLEGGIGASEATSFVTGKLQDVVEERFRSLTGLDRFQIDPYVSRTTGTVEPRVTISKRMIGDKIFVTYSTPLGSREEQVVKLEYFIGKNTSLIGVRDERGIVGGDVRFRFEFK